MMLFASNLSLKVNLVVNYDLPLKYGTQAEPDYEVYLHRIGRAGRFGRKGMFLIPCFCYCYFMLDIILPPLKCNYYACLYVVDPMIPFCFKYGKSIM